MLEAKSLISGATGLDACIRNEAAFRSFRTFPNVNLNYAILEYVTVVSIVWDMLLHVHGRNNLN